MIRTSVESMGSQEDDDRFPPTMIKVDPNSNNQDRQRGNKRNANQQQQKMSRMAASQELIIPRSKNINGAAGDDGMTIGEESLRQSQQQNGQPRRGAVKRAGSTVGEQNHLNPSRQEQNQLMDTVTKPQRKEITIIGGSHKDLPNFIKLVDTQHQNIAAMKHVPLKQIDLAEVNKYVGFATRSFIIQLEKMQARVRVLRMKDAGAFKAFPYARLILNRIEGSLQISEGDSLFDAGRNDKIATQELTRVRVVENNQAVQEPLDNSEFSKRANGSRQNRFRQPEEDPKPQGRNKPKNYTGTFQEKMLNEEYNDNGFNGVKGPDDYQFACMLKTTNKDFVLYLQSKVERDLVLHELNNFCAYSNKDIQLMCLRGQIMDRIDPVEAFNAWNLSMVCGPTQADLVQFQSRGLKAKRQSISEQTHIIKAESNYVAYIRDGVRCFVSESLRKELFVTDGLLFKESKTVMATVKGQYRRLFLCIDFQKQLIQQKYLRQDHKFESGKDIPFSEVIEFQRLDIDVFKGEHKERIDLNYKSKFLVRTLKRDQIFFAISDVEREIWLESFGKVIEQNETGHNNFNLKSTATNYLKSIDQSQTSALIKKETQLIKKTQNAVETSDVYRSEHLIVTKLAIKGTAMKAIENLSVLHSAKYHKRFFMLEFGEPYCYWYEGPGSGISHNSHKQRDIIGCRMLDDREVNDRIAERENKRSKSMLRRVLQNSVTKCAWNFSFILSFVDKEYELYAPTRSDRDQWIHVLQTIAEMNKTMIKTDFTSPFEWIKDQEEKKQKQAQEAMMTQSARFRAGQAEIEQQIFEQVHLWLRLNQSVLQTHKPVVVPYESDNLTLKQEGIRGMCYLITKAQATPAVNNSQVMTTTIKPQAAQEEIKMTRIELYLNMRIQTFLVQKIGVMGVSKYTFNEITQVESAQTQLLPQDFESNQASPEYKYCFKIQVKNNPFKVLACASEEDRSQWLRCIQLIIQMKNLSIDSSKVSIFTFEQFREYQLKLKYQEACIDGNEESEINPPSYPPNAQDLMNQDSEGDEVVNRVNQLEQSMGNHSTNLIRRQQSSVLGRRTASVDEIMMTFQEFSNGTFSMSYGSIEGYMQKEIEAKAMFKLTMRHLRYFRITFSTDKLCVKEFKGRESMRTFPLKDITSVKVIRNKPELEIAKPVFDEMQSWEVINEHYKMYLGTDEPTWPYTIVLELVQRKFTLSARTKREFDEWMRIFNLILKMNKIGFNVSEKNPYVFEDQELVATRGHGSMRTINLHNQNESIGNMLNDTQGIKGINDSQELVDFGVGSVIINEPLGLRDPDVDNVNTSNLHHSFSNKNSMVFQSQSLNGTQNLLRQQQHQSSRAAADDRQSSRFAQQMADNISQNFRQFHHHQQQESNIDGNRNMFNQSENNLHNRGRAPVKATMPVAPVVNQNITVQNITIKQMTMMQNGNCQSQVGNNRNSQSQALVSDYGDQGYKKNVNKEQQRASSMETIDIRADMEHPNDLSRRPGSSAEHRPRKKKKKKNRGKSMNQLTKKDDPYAFYNINNNQSQQKIENDASTIGGNEEVDSQVYKTDVVQDFIDEPLDQDSIDLPNSSYSKRNNNQQIQSTPLLIVDDIGEDNAKTVQSNFFQNNDSSMLFRQGLADAQDEITFIDPLELSINDKNHQSVPVMHHTKKLAPTEEPLKPSIPSYQLQKSNNFFSEPAQDQQQMQNFSTIISDKVDVIENDFGDMKGGFGNDYDNEYHDFQKKKSEESFSKRKGRKKLRQAIISDIEAYEESSSYRQRSDYDVASDKSQAKRSTDMQYAEDIHSEYEDNRNNYNLTSTKKERLHTDNNQESSNSAEPESRVLAKRRKHSSRQSRDDGQVHVSLSQVRLAGSNECFDTLDQVRQTINMPTLKNQRGDTIDSSDDYNSSSVLQGVGGYQSQSRLPSKVSIERIKSIAMGEAQDPIIGGYQSVTNQQISIPLIAKKKKKRIVRVKKKVTATIDIEQEDIVVPTKFEQTSAAILSTEYHAESSKEQSKRSYEGHKESSAQLNEIPNRNDDSMMNAMAKKNKQSFLKKESSRKQQSASHHYYESGQQDAMVTSQADPAAVQDNIVQLEDCSLSDWE